MNVRAKLSMLGLLAAVALAAGCSNSKGSSADAGPDAGLPDSGNLQPGQPDGGKDGGADGGIDAGVDAGTPGCLSDSDCLSTGLRCSPDGGCTLPAQPCNPAQGSDNCTVSASYCWIDGIQTENQCYCDPLPAGVGPDGGPGGVCYVQIPPCGPCVNQIDCGPASQVDFPGFCGPVGTQGNFCMPTAQAGCSQFPGYVPGSVDNTDVCVPSCGVCPCAACTNNADCPLPAAGVCNLLNGACNPPCQAQTDCVTGDVCNVLGKYLNPDTGLYYAGGQCGAPCATASDCDVYQGDAGVTYFCDLDGGAYCRPTGCLEDSECALAGLSSPTVVAWCDIWAGNVCTTSSCRVGPDPQTGDPFNDCLGGFTCDAGVGTVPPDAGPPLEGACVAVPCNQLRGGAHDACSAGQFCCGEGDAGAVCPAGTSVGKCYEASDPPWCITCDPSGGTFGNPSCTGEGEACTTARGVGAHPSFCGPPCDPNQIWTCPSGWDCVEQGDAGYNCTTRNGCPDAG